MSVACIREDAVNMHHVQLGAGPGVVLRACAPLSRPLPNYSLRADTR